MFTQSPIEASIWTAFVGLQEWLADTTILTPVFQAAVFTWLGFLLVRTVYQMATGGSPAQALGRYLVLVILSAVGFSLLRGHSDQEFRPLDGRGADWTNSAKVRASGRYQALGSSTHGLASYVQIHRAAAQLSGYLSGEIGQLFHDATYNQSPFLLLKTLAQTAGATLDDPDSVTDLNWLFENCADRADAPLLSETSSYSALFDLSRADCRQRHDALRGHLAAWARNKWGTSVWNVGQVGLAAVGAKLGIVDEETLQNKMIASAVVNLARSRMGQNTHDVHTGALLAGENQDPVLGSGTTFFNALGNTLSVAGAGNHYLGSLTGVDFLAGDARNKAAGVYNRIVQFLPPIRGFAKGLLALAFVFAAAALCFGTPRFMVAWFAALLLFTAYEPLSALLYETVMLFTNADASAHAMAALKSDPLTLAGAAVIDDNLARIQATYFYLQMGLTTGTAAGGMGLFVFSRRLGGGLADGLAAKVASLAQFVRGLPGGPAGRSL